MSDTAPRSFKDWWIVYFYGCHCFLWWFGSLLFCRFRIYYCTVQ